MQVWSLQGSKFIFSCISIIISPFMLIWNLEPVWAEATLWRIRMQRRNFQGPLEQPRFFVYALLFVRLNVISKFDATENLHHKTILHPRLSQSKSSKLWSSMLQTSPILTPHSPLASDDRFRGNRGPKR